MSTTHTPGPWIADGGCVWDSENGLVATTRDRADDLGFDAARLKPSEAANARLIAAAPDLLAALKAIVALAGFATEWNSGNMEQMPDKLPQLDTKTFCMARAAITKAKGGTK